MLDGMENIEAIAQSLIFWGFVLVLILGLSLGPRYLRSRERQRLYEVMRTAYEKGQPVPPELVASLSRQEAETAGASIPGFGPDRDLRRAVVLIAVGLGLAGLGFGLGYGISFASHVGGAVVGGIIAGSGAIPGFIGVAYLILWLTSGRGRRSY
ncbi:MAG TPA: DUF6249 domain-containing protein [Caulobacteraceae bacterium]|jgi:hypothetical protein|nr:DUF6249 domain-containing protein [Caulobacteraceae bacterium]